MQSHPLVSVIIPNYQYASYLKQRIDSVLHQKFQDFELILLDDCSTDFSREIIEQYRNHPKVSQIIYNQENSGSVFKQWVKGIENSKGKYIWIAESDDYASEHFLEEAVSVLLEDTSLGMVFTKTISVDTCGHLMTSFYEIRNDIFKRLEKFDNCIDRNNAPLFLASEMIIQNASCVVFRRAYLLKLDFQKLIMFKNTGDRFVYLGIAMQNRIRFIPKALNFMRIHDYNTTKVNTENGNIHHDRMIVLNYYFQDFLSSPYKRSIASFYKDNYFFFINYCSYEENIELLKNVKKTGGITNIFYHMIKFYMFLFKKKRIKARVLRSIYYRILVIQK